MSLRTIPPFRAEVLCGCGRVFRVAALGPAAGACRCTFRKRHQGTLSGALRSEARRERSAREGGFPCRSVGRCAPAASLGKGRGTRTVTSASSAQHEEICGAPPLLSEGRNEGEHRGNHDGGSVGCARHGLDLLNPGRWERRRCSGCPGRAQRRGRSSCCPVGGL